MFSFKFVLFCLFCFVCLFAFFFFFFYGVLLWYKGAGISFGRGVPNILGVIHFWKEKMGGGHKIFDDQNVGSHKMTTGLVCLFCSKRR